MLKSININKLKLNSQKKRLIIYGAELPNVRYAFMQHQQQKNTTNITSTNTEEKEHSKIDNFWLQTILNKQNSIFFKEKERKIISEMRGRENIHYTLICGSVKNFMEKNAQINPTHSFLYRYKFLTSALGFFYKENSSYIHSCKYATENYNVTYEVIEEKYFVENLNSWADFQIANLTQKPFSELYTSNDSNLENALEQNLRNTVRIKEIYIYFIIFINKYLIYYFSLHLLYSAFL